MDYVSRVQVGEGNQHIIDNGYYVVYLKLVLLFYSSVHYLGQTCLLEVHDYENVLKSAEVEFDVVALQSF